MMENAEVQSLDTPVVEQNSAPAEKMLRQSEVNEIVGRRSQEAAQRAVEQYKRSIEANQQSYSQPEISEKRFRELAAEEAQRLHEKQRSEWQERNEAEQAQRIVRNFWDKLEAGKQKYEDFDKVTGNIEYQRFPNTVHMLAEMVDNPHDVLYELAKKPIQACSNRNDGKGIPSRSDLRFKALGRLYKKQRIGSKLQNA